MSPKSSPDTYTMPLKQLLKLLETTADETPRRRRRPHARIDARRPSKVERVDVDVERV
jgi:hypothetical protein